MQISFDDMQAHLQPEIQMLLQHPLLKAIEDASLRTDEFTIIAKQYGICQSHFPLCLAAVASKIPDDITRLPTIEYLWEIHGNGNLSQSSEAEYRHFLSSLSPSSEAYSEEPLVPTSIYLKALQDLFFRQNLFGSLGALSLGTEIYVGNESQIILTGLRKAKKLSDEALSFWVSRIALSEKYFPRLLSALEPWAKSETNRHTILATARSSIRTRLAFWEGLAKIISPENAFFESDYQVQIEIDNS